MFSVSFFLLIIVSAESARILAVISMPSISHQKPFRPIWKELSKKHEVVLITTDPMNDPRLRNLTEINLHESYKLGILRGNQDALKDNKIGILDFVSLIIDTLVDLPDYQLSHPEVKKLIQDRNQKFDLLIFESMFLAFLPFSVRFDCPSIAVTSMDALPTTHEIFGNPTHPLLYENDILPFSYPMNFQERLFAVTFFLFSKGLQALYSMKIDDLTKKHFGDNYPSILTMKHNISMLFVNTNLALSKIRSFVPAVISIGGGIHLEDPKPLPKKLEKILESASEGAIYFSLGSNMKSQFLSEEMKNLFLETFSELPYTILWKFESELQHNYENIFIQKWFPQYDLLQHPNIKLFISQGGLQSTEEALHAHVPILGLPVYGDQEKNVRNIQAKGFGLFVDSSNLTKDFLKSTIKELIDNPKYRESAKKLSKIALDQPMSGVEKALWWIEYVLRHKGALHLKSPAADIPYYQYLMIEMFAFVTISISISTFITIKFVKLVVKLLRKLRKFKQH